MEQMCDTCKLESQMEPILTLVKCNNQTNNIFWWSILVPDNLRITFRTPTKVESFEQT